MAHAPCLRSLSQPASASWVWRLSGLACLVVAAPADSAFFTHRARTAPCGSGPMRVRPFPELEFREVQSASARDAPEQHSVLDLRGLGKELRRGPDVAAPSRPSGQL